MTINLMRPPPQKHETDYLRSVLKPVIEALRANPTLQAKFLTWVVKESGGKTEPALFSQRLLKIMDANYQAPSAYTVALLLKFAATFGINPKGN